jgi:hypothetical protein
MDGIEAKIQNCERIPTSDEVLEYLKTLCKQGQEDAAREYICKAHSQIRTPYRKKIEDEFGWNQKKCCDVYNL